MVKYITVQGLKMANSKNGSSLFSEAWREYDFDGRIYRIEKPQRLYVGTTTHRVLDSKGVVHCVPAPGFHGCVLRWHVKRGYKHVSF